MIDHTFDAVILLPRLQVQNANAISGPLTWGFPAPTAFLGFVHNLQRQVESESIRSDDLDLSSSLRLDGVAVIAHGFEPQINSAGYRHRFILSKNPVEAKKKIKSDKSLDGASFVEEGRVHIEVSLLIGVKGVPFGEEGQLNLAERVADAAQQMRLAGGSILPPRSGRRYQARFFELPESPEDQTGFVRRLCRSLLPGFALLHRQDLLAQHLQELRDSRPDATSLDALLDLVQLKHEPILAKGMALEDEVSEDESRVQKKVEWRSYRAKSGWLVPLPVGYGAISELHEAGSVKNARDDTVPFRFVESLYSLGEWRSPHRIEDVRKMFWFYRAQPESGLYLCDNDGTEHLA